MDRKSIVSILLTSALLAAGGASAAEQGYVTGAVQGPGGEAVDGATVYICTGLVKAEKADTPNASGKPRMVLYYSSANGAGRCEGTGRTNREGKFRVRYPVDKKGELFVWKKHYQALIRRDVASPSDLGIVKLAGGSDTEVLEKRNIEAAQQQQQLAASNAAQHRATLQRAWEANEKNFPNGLQLIDGEVITRADYQKARAMYDEAHKKNQSGDGLVVRKDRNGRPLYASQVVESAMGGWRVKGKILTPDGKPFEPAHTERPLITFGEKLEVTKQSAERWFVSNAAGLGQLYVDGNMDLRAPADKSWDILIWSKGYEPVLVRGVRSPADLGTIRFPARNDALKEVIRR